MTGEKRVGYPDVKDDLRAALAALPRLANGVPYIPPAVYAGAPEVVALLARVANWQLERPWLHPDGLIGPRTWAAKDAELEALAADLRVELRRAGLQAMWAGMFLHRIPIDTDGADVTSVRRLDP